MILRDERGAIIYSACRELCTCDSGLEAELAACREGLDLALHRTNKPIMVELDSAEAVSMLTAHSTDRSQHRTLIEEIRKLAANDAREISFTHCSRSQNKVSHELIWLLRGLLIQDAIRRRPRHQLGRPQYGRFGPT